MIYVGIDPGISGAIVFLGSDGSVLRMDKMPQDKNGDVGGQIATLLRLMVAGHVEMSCTLEKPMALPGTASKSMLSYGIGFGTIVGILTALRIPFAQVIPRQWSAWAHQGVTGDSTKIKSALAAQRRWPGAAIPRAPKTGRLHDGIVDALLIAEYGRIHRWQQKTVDIPCNPGTV